MKKILFIVLIPLLFSNCEKSSNTIPTCTNIEPVAEAPYIIAFCNTNGIVAIKDTTGIYYQILDPGTGTTPTFNSTVSVTYVAKFLDGTIIDESYATTPSTNPLNILIPGWQIGLRLISEGGHIKMVVPSALCYGCNGVPGIIPANTIIYFDIKLVDVI